MASESIEVDEIQASPDEARLNSDHSKHTWQPVTLSSRVFTFSSTEKITITQQTSEDFFFLYHKPLAPVGFIEAGWTCLLPVIWRRFLIFYSDTSNFYVLS